MASTTRRLALSAAFTLAAAGAHAACDPDKPVSELTYDEAQAVYECIAEDLHTGYMQGNKRWIPREFVTDYRDWKLASRLPANPGFHGGRFLLTRVNEVGYDAYTEFKDDGAEMPAGTVIAKESFEVTDAGKVRKGPLFLMQKVEEGVSPETADWYYMMVAPNGAPQAVNVMRACNDCHAMFDGQDQLGYPVEEVRVSN